MSVLAHAAGNPAYKYFPRRGKSWRRAGLDQDMSEDTSAAVRVGVEALKLLIERDRG